ncbi:hypothetical protein TruAng_002655 [Truncatella angustata]|nr:hypothetical protein TruAng_002655 [Truncatella angustata]
MSTRQGYLHLQDKSGTQVELINILRTRDQHDAHSVLQRLRAGESVDALVRFIQQGDLLLQCRLTTLQQSRYSFPMHSSMPSCLEPDANPFTSSILYHKIFYDQSTPGPLAHGKNPIQDKDRKYDWPYHAAELVEPSLETVRASQWTTVTDSDDLVRTLLKAYLYFDFPFNSLFHKDAFVASLVTGRKTYCSSLLVNAVLACACHCYRTPTSSTDFWSPKELIYQFMAEARRLWDREQSRNHITTIQAGAIIGYVLNCDGTDRIGVRYLQLSIDMAHDMGIFSHHVRLEDEQRQAVIAATAWGLFCMQARQMFHNRQPPMILEPPRVPMKDKLQRPYFSMCEFFVILNSIVARCYGEGRHLGPITFSEALGFREELLKWQITLPEELQPDRVVFPAHLKIYMQLFVLLIFLFVRFNGVEHPVTQSHPIRRNFISAQAVAASAKNSLESLVHLYYARHSFESCDTIMLAYLDLVGFDALRELGTTSGPERTSKLSTVVLCAKGLRDQARHFYIAEVVFSILRDSMSPDDARQLKQFASIDNEEKRKRLMAEHVFSHYLLNAGLDDATQQKRLDELVKSYEVLDLDDHDMNGIDGTNGNHLIDSPDEIGTPRNSRSPSSDYRIIP